MAMSDRPLDSFRHFVDRFSTRRYTFSISSGTAPRTESQVLYPQNFTSVKGLPIMAKKATAACKQRATRNWIAYLCESLVTSGIMPTWEAATYLTENLFGEKPNPRLLSATNAYEVTSQFLQRLYHPLVEAASRDIALPDGASLHVFTDISLTGQSAVLVVYMSGKTHSHQLLML